MIALIFLAALQVPASERVGPDSADLHSTVPAQVQATVTLSGQVEAPTGEPLPGAKLILGGQEGKVAEAVSGADGVFRFDHVVAGRYLLKVEAEGCRPVEMPLDLAATRRPPPLAIRMKLGVAEEVTVTESISEDRLAADANADAVKFDDDLLESLPLSDGGQGLLDLATDFLSPAALGASGVSIVVDGMEAGDIGVPMWNVKRVVINRDPYSAEYRRPGSARVEIVTNDGSRSHFHGGTSFRYRDSALDARNAFASAKPELQDQRIEGGFGGPLDGRGAAFFVGLEHDNVQEAKVVNARTPGGPVNLAVPATRQSSGASARVDLRPGVINRLALRYDFSQQLDGNRGVGGLRLPEQAFDASDRQHRIQLSARNFWTDHLLSDLRLRLERRDSRRGAPIGGPAVEVQGAFTGGAPQTFRSQRTSLAELQGAASYTRGRHELRFGGGLRLQFVEATDRSNFGGTFAFASLDDLARRTPLVYTISRGPGQASLSWRDGEAFVQDEVKLRPDLRLLAGLRWDWESLLRDANNLGPRLALAYSPGAGKTVLRAGFGVFYERLPGDVGLRSVLYDGERLQELVLSRPSYPDPWGSSAATVPPSVFRLAPGLTTPHLAQTSFSLERTLGHVHASVEYSYLRGADLFRARDVNAPRPGTGVRPDPRYLNVVEAESSGHMRGHALTVSLRGRLGRWLKATARYTLSSTRDDAASTQPGAGLSLSLPANSYDPGGEMARADSDRRHRFNMATVLKLPARFTLGAVLAVASGAPFDITTGSDDNHDTVVNDRPPGLPRNAGEGAGMARLDLRLARLFKAPTPFARPHSKHGQLALGLDAFNALNRTNAGEYVGVLTSPFFGRPITAQSARTIRLSLRYQF